MVPIIICEDNDAQRNKLQKLIENYLMIEELDMGIILCTNSPIDLINFLISNPQNYGVYFLDIDLNSKINGVELASKIRDNDIFGKIIFTTTHEEYVPLTFVYKVEAMDYIIKNDEQSFNKRVLEALVQAHNHFYSDKNVNEEFMQIKVGNQIKSIALKDIMFLETSSNSHKLILHLENAMIHFYDKISNYDKFSNELFRTHKSYLVNLNHIASFNRIERTCLMRNGEIILVSARKVSTLKRALWKRNK